jgi:protein-L-isoaspartate(D-aspartate) O-methyltransferase
MDEQEERWRQARDRMVEDQLAGRGIRDARVLEAMRAVPRHLFVPGEMRDLAYADAPRPIGQRQTISQPYIVALMTELLDLKGDEKVLEIGTGSGYQAAILGKLAKEVYSVERLPELAEKARKLLEALGYNNVHVVVADGTRGLPEHAPFDAIVVTAAAPQVPKPLLQQLADGGRLVLPVGSRDGQILERWIRRGDQWSQERITPVAFVPLVGEHGWSSEERPQRRWPW